MLGQETELEQPPVHADDEQRLLAHTGEPPVLQSPPNARRQSPAPSHVDGLRHAGGLSPEFWGMNEQVPRLPALLHAWHVPAHALLQQ